MFADAAFLAQVLPALWRVLRNPAGSFDLPEPDPGSLKKLFLFLLMCVLGLLVVAEASRRRREKRRRTNELKQLEAYLAKRHLSPQEHALMAAVMRSSPESSIKVAKHVLSFDRAVDQFLAEEEALAGGERLLVLRRLKSLRAKLDLDRVPAGVPLLSTRELPSGLELFLRLRGEPSSGVHLGRVIDLDDAGILVEVLRARGSRERTGADLREESVEEPGDSLRGKEIEAYFIREGDAGYSFQSRVLAEALWPRDGSKAILQVGHPSRLFREHRRHCVRVPLNEEARFVRIPFEPARRRSRPDAGELAPEPEEKGIMADLSGGGFRLIAADSAIRPGECVAVHLSFLDPASDPVRLVARCVRVYRSGSEYGFEFEELPAGAYSAIVRHVESVHRQLVCVG